MTKRETDELTMCLCLHDQSLEVQEMLVAKVALKEQNNLLHRPSQTISSVRILNCDPVKRTAHQEVPMPGW